MSVFGPPDMVAKLRRNFPQSLDGAPVLLPLETSLLRRSLDHWFAQNDIRPRVVAEFQDPDGRTIGMWKQQT